MSIEISAQTSEVLMQLMQDVEAGTDLRNLAVINRVGMAVASSRSATTDATAVTATSSALIDLSEKMSESIQHGKLRELLIRSSLGYDILMAVSKDLMIFGSLANPLRVGYVLGYLRELCTRIRGLIANELPPEQLEIFKKQEAERVAKEEPAPLLKPSVNQDIDAMKGVIGFLDDWGEEEGEASITPELIAQARATSAAKASGGLPVDLIKGATVAPKAPAATLKPGPAILANSAAETQIFDEIIEDIAVEPLEEAGAGKDVVTQFVGIDVYEDEIPPIPLDDIGTDSIHLLGTPAPVASVGMQVPVRPAVAAPAKPAPPSPLEYQTFAEEYGFEDAAIYDDEGKVVDFEAADEYDFDLDLNEQDAMSEALKALGWVEEKDGKKKQAQEQEPGEEE
ncbi:MAG TPA: roadblock/LC7 domain-containing protein [Candidatus Lokiarchaeia archaeon]|nr:roadblock/LC7 domain-containing protein [Candidatus Lokiarchaeia archaeon]